jgi:GDP-L-fucose synthase
MAPIWNGQPRRCLDVTRPQREFGFRAEMPFDDGLRRTVEWYPASRPVPVSVGQR